MPIISRFFGMIVKMYFLGSEHDPPHVHFIYGEYNGVINLNSLELIEGDLHGKALSLALEWTRARQNELLTM